MKNKQYFQLATAGNVAELNIYGDITSFPYAESDVSAYNLSQRLAELKDVTQINVNINSYGGEVMEGLAIYNALRRHKAHVTTYCDGSACSIASVIFMAGDERVMCKPSFLMIHDAWTFAAGNAKELRKQADDLETITSASVTAYMERINVSEEKLREMMEAETWLTHDEALEMGFATSIEESSSADKPSQCARNSWFEMLCKAIKQAGEDDRSDEEDEDNAGSAEPPSNPPETELEVEPSDEDETAEGAESEPVDVPDDDSESDDTPDDEKDDKDEEENPENPAQRWSGFFNALFRD